MDGHLHTPGLQRSVEVSRVAEALKIHRLQALGAMHATWAYIDEQGILGAVTPRSSRFESALEVGQLVGQPGIVEAMEEVGLMETDDDGTIRLPASERKRFPALARAKATAKKRRNRANRKAREQGDAQGYSQGDKVGGRSPVMSPSPAANGCDSEGGLPGGGHVAPRVVADAPKTPLAVPGSPLLSAAGGGLQQGDRGGDPRAGARASLSSTNDQGVESPLLDQAPGVSEAVEAPVEPKPKRARRKAATKPVEVSDPWAGLRPDDEPATKSWRKDEAFMAKWRAWRSQEALRDAWEDWYDRRAGEEGRKKHGAYTNGAAQFERLVYGSESIEHAIATLHEAKTEPWKAPTPKYVEPPAPKLLGATGANGNPFGGDMKPDRYGKINGYDATTLRELQRFTSTIDFDALNGK